MGGAMYRPGALRVQHILMTAGEIRRLRKRLRWTQARLASFIGVHRSTLSRWESGHHRPSEVSARRLGTLALTTQRTRSARACRTLQGVSGISRAHQAERSEVLARLNGRRIVASISGGKDSAAMSLYLHELGIEHDRVFLDTGWESPITYEYLNHELPKAIGSITWVSGPQQMEELIRHKGMFPGRRVRFCTQLLKVLPIARYLRKQMDAGQDVVNAVGIRAAESAARARMTLWEWQEDFDCEVWRPVLNWTEQQVIAIHHRHQLRPNPLYLLGARRVGCWPCIYARKSEIRLIAEADPARIVRLRVLEDEVAIAAGARAAQQGRELQNPPAWFQNPTSRPGPDGKRDGTCWPIDRVVEWSRTAAQGPAQSPGEFLFAAQLDGCMETGLEAADFPS
jgi:3'-phosphoadenosine 5'-phosphosulfate sulfotransferase (PAPS reductase)/FAD synthetase/DNA-binding XRE family transcriptional regulator